MADFNLYFPQEQNLEGTVFECDPNDSGGATKVGLTVDDLREYGLDCNQDNHIDAEDVKLMIIPQAGLVLKKIYWDYFQADSINNQKLAEFIVDSGLNQGRVLITKYLQTILGIEVDGQIGKQTISSINNSNPVHTYLSLCSLRLKRYSDIVIARPSQRRYFKGWVNRLNAIKVV